MVAQHHGVAPPFEWDTLKKVIGRNDGLGFSIHFGFPTVVVEIVDEQDGRTLRPCLCDEKAGFLANYFDRSRFRSDGAVDFTQAVVLDY